MAGPQVPSPLRGFPVVEVELVVDLLVDVVAELRC